MKKEGQLFLYEATHDRDSIALTQYLYRQQAQLHFFALGFGKLLWGQLEMYCWRAVMTDIPWHVSAWRLTSVEGEWTDNRQSQVTSDSL